MSMKVLVIDIEVSANLAYVWRLFDVNVNLDMLESSGEILCFAAKELGKPDTEFRSVWGDGKKRMLRRLRLLLSKYDVIVGYNSTAFDVKWINAQLLLNGYQPPSPFRQVDLYRVVKQNFKFPSNKLEYVSRALGIGKKTKHAGFETWKGCAAGDPKSQRLMEKYNIQDVKLTEALYNRLLPWVKNHPDRNLYIDEDKITGKPQCSHCMGNMQRRGFCYTPRGKYQQFACLKCGVWHRSKRNQAPRRDTQRAVY